MEDVRPILMHKDARFVVAVVSVAGDVGAPVDDEHALIPYARQTLGQDASGKSSTHDQPIVHAGYSAGVMAKMGKAGARSAGGRSPIASSISLCIAAQVLSHEPAAKCRSTFASHASLG